MKKEINKMTHADEFKLYENMFSEKQLNNPEPLKESMEKQTLTESVEGKIKNLLANADNKLVAWIIGGIQNYLASELEYTDEYEETDLSNEETVKIETEDGGSFIVKKADADRAKQISLLANALYEYSDDYAGYEYFVALLDQFDIVWQYAIEDDED